MIFKDKIKQNTDHSPLDTVETPPPPSHKLDTVPSRTAIYFILFYFILFYFIYIYIYIFLFCLTPRVCTSVGP